MHDRELVLLAQLVDEAARPHVDGRRLLLEQLELDDLLLRHQPSLLENHPLALGELALDLVRVRVRVRVRARARARDWVGVGVGVGVRVGGVAAVPWAVSLHASSSESAESSLRYCGVRWG